ncbi:hypothetical protein LAZ67_8002159 [Cordylochernes scorpioides]|uniref:RNA-directed DNA polymerase n=1 Tax=Cordylochernes scorpioides TaxID=51811 RepID=A0ABY6KVT1_9ARAC|nr:hypothetical protein LAZ67_8002159 [Cordylochernes scorpioides]
MLGTMMRDRFVAGIKSEILQKKLLQEDDDVTLDKVLQCTANKAIELDRYPIPSIDEIFSKLSTSTVLSTLDLSLAYLQVMLAEEAKAVVHINTTKRLFSYKRLPYDVAVAPNKFQRIMEGLFSDLPGVACYIDDILVAGKYFEDHEQKNDRKEECPIAFASRTLTEAEKRFSQLEKKALSITFGVEKFRQYLLGRKFVLVTDNRPLIHIFSPHKPIPIRALSRIKRWTLKLAAFNYTVEFRKTSDNSNVDALSRLPLESSVRESLDEDQVLLLRKSNEVPFSFMEVANETPQDKILSIVLRNVREGNCVEIHKGIDSNIEELTRECRVCQESASMPPATISEWTWPEKPWHRLHLDLADNGRQFVSGEFEQFTKMNGIRHTKTSPYNPSTNGLAERYVREFKNLLRKNNGKDDLETNLQSFLFAHRAFPQTVIKEFPGGTANEEKFKIKILEFNTKMGYPRGVFHEAVRRQEQFTTEVTSGNKEETASVHVPPCTPIPGPVAVHVPSCTPKPEAAAVQVPVRSPRPQRARKPLDRLEALIDTGSQRSLITENCREKLNLPVKKSQLTVFGIGNQPIQQSAKCHETILALERKLHKSSNLLQQYKDFMMEYLSLNHMELIPKNERDKPSDKCYYIPHHCVLRDQSSTTKLRVVFDASCKTSNNYSLNDFLHTGPKLQHDIFNILVKFRTNPIAFTGDIEKMYRQIKVNSSDLDFQRIFWRNSPLESLLEYRLLTVTYGMSCAPYLAIHDLLSGATTIEEAKVLIDDIRKILLSGGFCIRKWMSNVPEVLSEVPEALKAHDSYEIGDNSSVKILGINWNPSTDNFTITVNSLKDVYSKRQLLSDISRIYDPLGWLSPRRVKMDLAMLNHIKIPRYISCKGLIHSLGLHGFYDASESAYSSVVYMKSRFKSGHVQVTLIAAKTKVAPLKATSIPRLELCAALLLSNLYDSICSSLLLQIDRVILWTDSQIVLCWIKSESKHWKPFVDCASRGITSSELVNHSLWWNGPDWLSNSSLQDPLPNTYELPKEVCHEKRKTVPIVHFITCPILDFIFKFSTFRKLSRVTAWLLRFIHNARHSSDKIKHKELSSNELDNSIRTLIQIIQSSEFKTEIQCCIQSKVLPSNSKLLSINPFIDSSGILRVGGRLRKSNLQFNEKHPIILPHNHFVTELIVQQFPVEHLHSGLQLTLCAIRQKYWIPSGRILIKKLINRCMTCFKTKRQVSKQIMGDLPIHRIIPSSPFSKTGIDFAGPFITKPNVIRTKVTLKSYIALFICFSTKAIHLEIVSDLSTPAFLAAFRRFISRRGKPSDIFTDNATNFKGAKNILNNIHQLVKDSSIQSYVANEHITWHFIPPSAPNFGGIWEAGIKSLKYHLLRCLKSAVLNFEELNTLTSQIEACLNSRSLYPMSSDPNDFNPLTPGHFLIARPLTALPEPSYHPNDNYLTRWKLIQKARDVFWQRWSREYLNNLQQRSKWKKPSSNLKVGDLVLVKDFPMPSMQWSLGRITKVSPGADGNVRVVELQTEKQHHLIRPISKIALLPF